MSLDIFAPAITAADQNVMRNAAPDLPAEFSESAGMAWQSMTQWHNSNAEFNARDAVLGEYIDHVRDKTGETLPMLRGLATATSDIVTLDDFNAAQAKINEKNPTAMLRPLSDADVSAMTLRKLRSVHQDMDDFSRREGTWGGTAGTVVGTLGGALADPIGIATLPLGGAGEAGIVLRSLEFALISGGTEAVSSAMTYKVHEAAVPGSSKEIPGQIAGATLFGGLLGAGFGVLGKLAKEGAKPLPTAVREEVNAATSEAQFHVVNPFPTAAGEAAARDAHVDATTSLLRGESVKAGEQFDRMHIADYATAAKADTPDALALAGERHLRPETFDDIPDVERFDAMPGVGDDAASYWESRIANATPEERAAFGATDAASETISSAAIRFDGKVYEGALHADAFEAAAKASNKEFGDVIAKTKPQDSGFVTSAGRYVDREEAAKIANAAEQTVGVKDLAAENLPDGYFKRNASAAPARDLSPAEITKLAADPQTESAVLRNLDRIRVDMPDADYTVQLRQPDGSYQLLTRKLEDVLADIDGMEMTGNELMACATGLIAAE